MWDRVEKIFPELFLAIGRQSVAMRLAILGIILGITFVVALVWDPLLSALRKGETIQIPVRAIAFVVAIVIILLPATLFGMRWIRQRLRLKAFCRQWVEFRNHFEVLYTKIEIMLLRGPSGFEDPAWSDVCEVIQEYFSRTAQLRRLLFLLGERALVVQENQHWRELKSKHAIFKERDYLTPFSFLLDIGAPISNVNNHGEAIHAALFISDDYLEFLQYKYRFLARIVRPVLQPVLIADDPAPTP